MFVFFTCNLCLVPRSLFTKDQFSNICFCEIFVARHSIQQLFLILSFFHSFSEGWHFLKCNIKPIFYINISRRQSFSKLNLIYRPLTHTVIHTAVVGCIDPASPASGSLLTFLLLQTDWLTDCRLIVSGKLDKDDLQTLVIEPIF